MSSSLLYKKEFIKMITWIISIAVIITGMYFIYKYLEVEINDKGKNVLYELAVIGALVMVIDIVQLLWTCIKGC